MKRNSEPNEGIGRRDRPYYLKRPRPQRCKGRIYLKRPRNRPAPRGDRHSSSQEFPSPGVGETDALERRTQPKGSVKCCTLDRIGKSMDLILEPSGQIVAVDPRIVAILGYAESSLIGTPWIDYVDGRDRPFVLQTSAPILGDRNGNLVPNPMTIPPFRLTTRDGAAIWVEATIARQISDRRVRLSCRRTAQPPRNESQPGVGLQEVIRPMWRAIAAGRIDWNHCLAEIGKALGVTGATIARWRVGGDLDLPRAVRLEGCWGRVPDCCAERDEWTVLLDAIPPFTGAGVVAIADCQALPAGAIGSDRSLDEAGVRALLCIPIRPAPGSATDNPRTALPEGRICLYDDRGSHYWSPEQIQPLEWLAEAIAGLWERDDASASDAAPCSQSRQCEATQDALENSERRYRELLELSFEAILIHHHGQIIWSNAAAARLLGAAVAGELEGRSVFDFVTPPYREIVRQRIENVTTGQPTPTVEEQFIRLDGETIDVEVTAMPIAYDGRPCIQVFVRDISARAKAVADVRSRARQQQAVAQLGQRALKGIPTAVLMQDAVQLVADTLAVEYCKILELLPDPGDDRDAPASFLVRAGVGWKSGIVGRARVEASQRSQAGYTLRQGESTIVQDLRTETRFEGMPLLHEHGVISGMTAIIGHPPHRTPPSGTHPELALVSEVPFVGILGVHSRKLREFSADDLHFLEAIANILAAAIDRERSDARAYIMQRAIAECANGIVITDARSRDNPIVYVNPSFEQISGYSAREAIGRNCRFLQGGDRDQSSLETVRWAIARGQNCHGILRNYRKDGSMFWNELSISPIRNEAGEVSHFIGIQSDITYRVEADVRLRESHEQTIAILESIADGFVALDADFCLTYINRTAESLLTERQGEAIGQSFWDAFPEAIAAAFESEYRRAIAEQVSIAFEAFYPEDNRWLAIHAYPAREGLSVYFQDITANRRAQEALRESEQRYRRIVETMTEGVWSLDAEGNTTFINRQLARMLGVRVEQAIGKPWLSFVDPKHRPWAELFLEQVRQGHTQQQDVRFRQADGGDRWTIVSANAGQPGDSKAGILLTIADISDRKQAEMALARQIRRERLMVKIQNRIRQSLDLDDILQTTVGEVRPFLQADRVLIYQFKPDWNGQIVVESVEPGWLPLLGMEIKDTCFNDRFVESYLDGRIGAIADLERSKLSQCHKTLLSEFQVKANLVVPIVKSLGQGHPSGDPSRESPQRRLWGLLVAHHCSQPRQWLPQEIDLLQQLATQLGIAIEQSELYETVRQIGSDLEIQVRNRTAELQQSLEFAHVVRRITQKVGESLDEGQILQTAVREIAQVLEIDYCCAALYDGDRTTATICYEYSTDDVGSGLGQVLKIADARKIYEQLWRGEYFLSYDRGRVPLIDPQALGDLACPDLDRMLQARILVPIFDDRGTIGHLSVLHSQVRTWSDIEIRLLQQVAAHCAIALRQARLYEASLAQVRELEKVNRLKDEFLSTVSHELRTPMANMKMAIQMLKIGYKQYDPNLTNDLEKQEAIAAKLSRYFQILDDECHREISLINDLLDLQRLDSGLAKEFTPVDLGEWLPQLLHGFHERARNRQQTIALELADNLPTLTTDVSGFERIVSELLNNACKYTPPGESIRLVACDAGDRLQLQVVNTGVEIPPNEIGHIFEKFYRVPSADPWKQGGTGLGLALVQKLATHLGGAIAVESASRVTCFTLELPWDLES
ncbi:MAG: PAS domain S-box protein [Cyanobacteria bacterium J007]|nr:MAG: PAS domain S-box protein [Cyanobacteria bacterium J007]